MLFWLGVLVGLISAIAGTNAGLHQTVAVGVNILIGGYMAIFLTSVLIQAVPAALEIPCGGLLATAIVAVGTILLLQGVYVAMFPGSNRITFPRVVEVLASGGLGFLAGFFAVALVCTLIYTTVNLKDIPFFSHQAVQTHTQYVCWWTDHVHRIVRTSNAPKDTMEALQILNKLVCPEGKAQPH